MMISVEEEQAQQEEQERQDDDNYNNFNNNNNEEKKRRSKKSYHVRNEQKSTEFISFFLSKNLVLNALLIDQKVEIDDRRYGLWNEVLTEGDVDRLFESYQNQLVYMNTMLRNTDNKELFLRLNYNNYLLNIAEGKLK